MRLTLRTLLAYLDDTLEPAQARLIGQKVAESDAAQELIARINKVTRRRRLMPPPATGPGAKLDPNTLAEYLDNELSSEELATVEEVCLESDVHLAEVAACHQILTLVLGEPAMVPPVARQRMYGLIQGREAIPYRKPPAARLAASGDRASLSADEADEAVLGLSLSKSAPWLLPAAAVLLLAASAGAVWMAMRPPQATQVAVAPPPELEKAPPPKVQEEPEKPQPEPKPEQKPEPPPEPDKKAITEIKPEVPAKPEPSTALLPPSTKRVEVGRYVYADDRPGVLLRATAGEKAAWQRLAPGSRVATAERLVSLPGYRGEVRQDNRVHLQLWGNLPEFSPIPVVESVVTLHENPAFDLDFTLERGRAVLSNQKPEPEAEATIRVRFLDEIWDVTLVGPKSVVAVELVSAYDQGAPFSLKPGGEKPAAQLALLVLDGQAGLKVRGRQYGGLRAPTLFRWDSDQGAGAQPIPLPRSPDWWADRTPTATPFAKEMQTALGQLADRLTPKVALEVALMELRRGASPAGRILALRCYAAVDNLNSLLDALSDEQHDDLRDFAIPVLRGWSGLRAEHDLRLYKLLVSKDVSEPHAEIILQLLHGFAREQLDNPHTYETLIEYLRHGRLAVRELAFWHLRLLVPDWKKAGYHPAGTNEERERGYEQWKKLVPKGKLPARGKPGPGKAGG